LLGLAQPRFWCHYARRRPAWGNAARFGRSAEFCGVLPFAWQSDYSIRPFNWALSALNSAIGVSDSAILAISARMMPCDRGGRTY